jgi:hypothetical protein
MSIFAGAAAGLFGVLWHSTVSSVWLRAMAGRAIEHREETLAQMVAGAVLRGGAGVMLGVLFWASWGLIALVNAPWYVAGTAFGLFVWGAIALLGAATIALLGAATLTASGVRVTWLMVHAVEWLATCLAVGLLCAYSWQR